MAEFKALPDETTIKEASDLDVFDIIGDKVKFGSIFASEKACQAYVEHLATVREEALEAAGTKIVVIGCGEWSVIKSYAESAKFKGELFADPTRNLYHALGMDIENLERTAKGQSRPSYLLLGTISSTIQSIWRGPLTNPLSIGKQGNLSQLGGEFIFGPGPQCTFASRMKHTEDHTEVSELMKQADVSFP